MAWLRVIEGKMRGATFFLEEDPRTAGREPDNRIHLDDGQASRKHARFEWSERDGHHIVSDLDSKNGTSFNGKQLRGPQPLADQDRVKIGSHLLIYELRGRPGYRDEGLASAGWLKVIAGPKLGATYHLGDRICTLGRDPGNLIQLVDDDTSRRHVQFRWTGEHYMLTDLGSTNGTKVNGLFRAEHCLVHGDRIGVGGHTLLYEAKGSVRYRDEGLAGKNVAPRLTSEDTNIAYELGAELGSIEIDVEVVEDSSFDTSFDIELNLERSGATPEPEPAPERAMASPAARAEAARERVAAHVETRAGIPSFLESVLDEVLRYGEPDRVLFLFFSGASLTPRASRVRGQPGTHATPDNLLQAAIRHVVRNKQAIRKNALLAGSKRDPSELYDRVGSVVCAPILTAHVDYGVVYADYLGPRAGSFGSVDLEFYRELGTLLAAGLAHRTQRRSR